MDATSTEPRMRPLLLAAIAVIAVGATVYWFGASVSNGPVPDSEPTQEFITPAELFHLSYNPSQVAVKAGGSAEVTITVQPGEGFAKTLTFRVEDILKGTASVQGQAVLSAEFPLANLASADFSKGIPLSLASADTAAKGLYVISFSVQAGSDKKSYVLPVSVE